MHENGHKAEFAFTNFYVLITEPSTYKDDLSGTMVMNHVSVLPLFCVAAGDTVHFTNAKLMSYI